MITNQETALLALLAEKEYYGYELEKTVEFRAMREWTDLSISGIYKSLRKLEDRSLVSSSREMTEENRLRKIYRITEEGITVLKSEIGVLLKTYKQQKWPVDIGIYNLNLLDREDVIVDLKMYRETLLNKITEYQDVELCLNEQDCSFHHVAVVSRQLAIFQGELSWVDEFVRYLEEK